MPIPFFILKRIKLARLNGPQIADTLIKLAQAIDQAGVDSCAINIEYVSDQDRLIPGDLIPMITFSLVRQQVLQVSADENVIDAESIEVRPMSQPAVEMPNPFFRAAEAACDEDPHPEE